MIKNSISLAMQKTIAHCLLQLRIGFRDGAYFFTTIMVPIGVYWFFAVPESKTAYIASYLVCSFSAFAFFGVVFLQYAINTAQEKDSTWSQYQQSLPFSMPIPLVARFFTSFIFGFLACVGIYIVARFYTPIDLSPRVFAKVLVLLTIGSFPFLVFGIFCGKLFSPKAVVPIANFLYLVLSFSGGLWKPPEILPEVLKKICPYLPTYHYGRLVWSIPADQIVFEQKNALYLIGFSIFFILALILLETRAIKRRI